MKFFIVLFKNKEKKKIINKFKTYEKAIEFYDNKIKNNNIIFNKEIENGKECYFELGLLEKESNDFNSYYIKDSLGRQIKAELNTNEYKIMEMKDYKVEELIFDVNKNTKITFDDFLKKYLRSSGLKMISKINNKIVVQENEVVNLFSFKSMFESERFLISLNDFMIDKNRSDVLIVFDTSKEQRKYLYDILEKKGISKSILYRRFTTFPK
jgi:hypothetical protein